MKKKRKKMVKEYLLDTQILTNTRAYIVTTLFTESSIVLPLSFLIIQKNYYTRPKRKKYIIFIQRFQFIFLIFENMSTTMKAIMIIVKQLLHYPTISFFFFPHIYIHRHINIYTYIVHISTWI